MAVKKTKKVRARKAVRHHDSSRIKGERYVCVPCGSEVVMTECGPEFQELMCCGVVMQKKK